MNDTHNPNLKSWIASATLLGVDFPIQNLPFGVFSRPIIGRMPHVGVAIGDQIVDIGACRNESLFSGEAEVAAEACLDPTLNRFMSLGKKYWSALRQRVSEMLRLDFPRKDLVERCLVPIAEAEMMVPALIGDFTDFYASVYHATNVGSMFRPDSPLLPNYKYVPIAYHGRSSSVVISGTRFRRPAGQLKDDQADAPTFGPCKLLDYELEVGFFVGPGNEMGRQITLDNAEDHIFGLCLVNDWSARDIQKWEYQPLGPFLSKSFATTISPWIVTLEALEPFRARSFTRSDGDPKLLPYLDSRTNNERGGIDLQLEVYLSSRKMRESNIPPFHISTGNFQDLYWTIAQMLTHHTSNGCNLRPGDLIASGTVSGNTRESRGCLLEYTMRGAESIQLPSGEERRFLEDGDEVMMRGFCERKGFVRIGLGECRGEVRPNQ